MWNSDHAAFVDVGFLVVRGGRSSIECDVISNRMTSWSKPVVKSSTTAWFVTRPATVGLASVRSRTDLPLPVKARRGLDGDSEGYYDGRGGSKSGRVLGRSDGNIIFMKP